VSNRNGGTYYCLLLNFVPTDYCSFNGPINFIRTLLEEVDEYVFAGAQM
jgi:hypothetical protein